MKRNIVPKMVSTKSKNKALSCSTPEQAPESPSRDSDSLCDSDTSSPVPFLCTQDGVEGDTDVVWNYYTPKSDKNNAKIKTPLSRRKPIKKVIESPLPRRRIVKAAQKKTEIFQDLIELNKNLQDFIAKKSSTPKKHDEEDIFNDSDSPVSPKNGLKTNSRCLRRNVLSSKFTKPDPEAALESDDSMNECLILASQVVEENLQSIPAKRSRVETRSNSKAKSDHNFKMNNDSMDNILNTINISSPAMKRVKNSPSLANDSFDSLVGNLNDSMLEQLTQMPIKDNSKRLNKSNTDWTVQDVVMHDSPSAKSVFYRYNSMPESPVTDLNKPSTSGMVFGRYNSLPLRDTEKHTGDSPIRCTQDEIKRKHLQAREKLLAKRQLPFTSSQASQQPSATKNFAPKKSSFQPKLPSSMNFQAEPAPKKTYFQPKVPTSINQAQNEPKQTFQPKVSSFVPPAVQNVQKKTSFQPKVPSSTMQAQNEKAPHNIQITSQVNNQNTLQAAVDLKQIIERKRQEALQKLRRRQPQNKP